MDDDDDDDDEEEEELLSTSFDIEWKGSNAVSPVDSHSSMSPCGAQILMCPLGAAENTNFSFIIASLPPLLTLSLSLRLGVATTPSRPSVARLCRCAVRAAAMSPADGTDSALTPVECDADDEEDALGDSSR